MKKSLDSLKDFQVSLRIGGFGNWYLLDTLGSCSCHNIQFDIGFQRYLLFYSVLLIVVHNSCSKYTSHLQKCRNIEISFILDC